MAGRKAEPWYWRSRNEWYVTIKGTRHRLGADKDEAERRFHLLMAGEELPAFQPTTRDWLYASEVADEFQVFV